MISPGISASALTHRLAVLLTLAKNHAAASEVYIGGVVDAPLSDWLAGRLQHAGLGAR